MWFLDISSAFPGGYSMEGAECGGRSDFCLTVTLVYWIARVGDN